MAQTALEALRKQSAEAAEQAKKEAERREKVRFLLAAHRVSFLPRETATKTKEITRCQTLPDPNRWHHLAISRPRHSAMECSEAVQEAEGHVKKLQQARYRRPGRFWSEFSLCH